MDALLVVHAEDAGGCGAAELDELLRREASGIHAEVPENLHAVLDAGAAVRNLAEVVSCQAAF